MNSFAKFIGAHCGVTAQERDFEEWLGKVETTVGAHVLLLSDTALHAFEEGVSASDFALQLMGGTP